MLIPDMKKLMRGINKQITLFVERSLERFIFVAQVRDVVNENQKITLKVAKTSNGIEIPDVRLSGLNLGNGRGFLVLPKVGDICIILNMFGSFYHITNIYDDLTKSPDFQVQIQNNELYIVSQTWGSFIKFTTADDIIINTQTGAKFKLTKAGAFKVFNKNGYGIECDASGNVIIRDQSGSASTTSSPGTF